LITANKKEKQAKEEMFVLEESRDQKNGDTTQRSLRKE